MAKAIFRQTTAALVAALLYAIYPTFVFYGPLLASEHLYVLLMLGVLYMALKQRLSWVHSLLSGALWGCAILTRGSALFYTPVIVGLFLLRHSGNVGLRLRRRIALAAITMLVMFSIVFPWCIRNALVFGKFVGLSTSTGWALYAGHHAGGPGTLIYEYQGQELKLYEEGRRLAVEYLRAHPLSVLRSALVKTRSLYWPTSGSVEWSIRTGRDPSSGDWQAKPLRGLSLARVLPVMGYGGLLVLLFLSLLRRRLWPRRAKWVIAGLIFFGWMGYAVYFAIPRYRYFQEVLFCMLAGTVVARMMSRDPSLPEMGDQ